jgi:hypothetical protein
LAEGLGLRSGVGLLDGFDQEGEGLKTLLKRGDTRLEGVSSLVLECRFCEHVVDGGPD